jgi:hypothetical protein
VFHGRDAHATDGADHGKKIETVISIVAEAAMAIKSISIVAEAAMASRC